MRPSSLQTQTRQLDFGGAGGRVIPAFVQVKCEGQAGGVGGHQTLQCHSRVSSKTEVLSAAQTQ